MNINICVIGVRDTVERISKHVAEFQDKVSISNFIYNKKEDILEILKEQQDKFDVILFSGSASYYYAKHEMELIKPATYVPRVAASLLQTLWGIRDSGLDYTRMSIDVLKEDNVYETLDELNICTENVYVKSSYGIQDSNELMKFVEELVPYHYDLWKKGKTSIAITSNLSAYKALRELGVPVFRLYPTAMSIRNSIINAIHIADVEKIKSTQIAIQIVKIKNAVQHYTFEYKFLKLRNQFEAILIEYAQQNFGSFFSFGNNEYLIFTTRGLLSKENIESKFKNIIDLEKNLNIVFSSGVGYGSTVYVAEKNARIALSYATNEDKSCCYIVDEDENIVGPIGDELGNDLIFQLLVKDEKIQSMAEKMNISSTYVAKIKAVMQQTGRSEVDTEELAELLDVSLRSSTRIIKKFMDNDYAEVVGNYRKSPKGRSRRLFKFNI